jgi:sodium/hydrogen antiporter
MPHEADPFLVTLSLVGAVIIISALLSGLIERSGAPQVAVLLALGAILGPFGLGLIDPRLDSPILRVVSTLSLALVLFTDALSLSLSEIRRHARLALLVVGPGTLLSAALVTLAGRLLLDLPWALAAILGAALASTDPVLLRGLMRRPGIHSATRLALRLESGLNDVVLLPIVLVAMALLGSRPLDQPGEAPRMALQLFLLGPGAGVAVGLLGVATLDLVRRRLGVRRDYESLYSLGVAFTAFAAAESVHGSGFLAAFAAGMTISIFDVELCDCFQEYGETTAELALLFTFVLLGSSLIWSGFASAGLFEWLFAVVALLVRPVAFLASLGPARLLERRNLLLIAWYGPRGLSSLLLVLLPVFAGTPGAGRLFSLCSLVVLLSVALHGGSLMLYGWKRDGAGAPPPPPPPQPPPPSETVPVVGTEPLPESLDVPELQRLQAEGQPVVVVDSRTIRSLEGSDRGAAGAIRLDPERPAREAERLQLPRDAWLVVFCA